MSVAALYGLADMKQTSGDSTGSDHERVEHSATVDNVQPEIEPLLPQGALQAAEVNLYRKSPLRWIMTQKKNFVLPVKGGIIRLICVDPGQDLWTIEWKNTAVRGQEPQRLGNAVPLIYAQGIAEDSAREMPGGLAMVQREARWMHRPASAKSRLFARKLGINPDLFPKQGQLSNAITAITGDW
jgi:hypothetical protein